MRKSCSNVLNKSGLNANNSKTYLDPGANVFVPKSYEPSPQVNSQNRHENVLSPTALHAPIQDATVYSSLSPLGIDKPNSTVTNSSGVWKCDDGNKEVAGFTQRKPHQETRENWRRTEISKDQSGDNREFVMPRPPRRMETDRKNVEHVENPQKLLRNTHAFKKQKPDSAKFVDNCACDHYRDNITPPTFYQTLVSPPKNVNEDLKEDEQNASASVTNTFSDREKERKKDNFTRADQSFSLPLPNNDRSITKSKLNEKAKRTSSSYRDPRMEREKSSKTEELSKPLEKKPIKTRWSCAESDKEKRENDCEYDSWSKKWQILSSLPTNKVVVHEIFGDLFEQPKEFSLAHCVAEDLRMGSGIAVSFKREFKNLPDLFDQRAKQGGLATLRDEKNNRFVYYLVTKKESTGKPTYFNLWKSLCAMRTHVKEHKVKQIAIPRLGCGLDRLEWAKVKSMLIFVFQEVDVEITVCNFQQDDHDQEKKQKPTQSPLVTRNSHITEIECDTFILYFTTCNGDEDEIMRDLSEKSKYLPEFRKHKPKALGDIVYFEDNIQNWGLCGCVVRETDSSPLSFSSLHKCIQKINKKNDGFRDNRFVYIATQWVNSSSYHDELINEKITTVLTTYLRNVSVYMCQGSMKNLN